MNPTNVRAPKTVTTPPETVPAFRLTITERAAKELQAVMTSEGSKAQGLLLGVEPGGCAGFQYSLAFAEKVNGDEIPVEASGIKVFVQRQDAPVLDGITIDFVDTAHGSGFSIKNPNAKSTCGCGSTFDA